MDKQQKKLKRDGRRMEKRRPQRARRCITILNAFYNDLDVEIEEGLCRMGTILPNLRTILGSILTPYRTEMMVWDKELRLAGSIDMIFENPDGTLQVYDWKRCKNIKKDNRWQSSTTECISHLPDTNFWHYSLQLNTYKYMLEKNYGKKVTDMYLVCSASK